MLFKNDVVDILRSVVVIKLFEGSFQEKLDKALWNRHDLVELTFHMPTNCDLCVKPLSNLLRPPPAFECRRAFFVVISFSSFSFLHLFVLFDQHFFRLSDAFP